MKKALTTVFAAAALVMLVVPAADAMFERSLPTTYSHAKAARVAKKVTKATYAARPASIFVPYVVVCPEPDAGDSWGYCIPVPTQNDTGTSITNGVAAGVTYNDGAGT